MRFACSILTTRPGEMRHAPAVVEAASLDEAIGKALRIARRGYPARDGWGQHHVVAQPADVVIDPDGQVVLTPAD